MTQIKNETTRNTAALVLNIVFGVLSCGVTWIIAAMAADDE